MANPTGLEPRLRLMLFCPPLLGEQIGRGAVVTGGFATSQRIHPPHLTVAEEATGYH
jgi:hypothetical protein